jgi:hypothetical protein
VRSVWLREPDGQVPVQVWLRLSGPQGRDNGANRKGSGRL